MYKIPFGGHHLLVHLPPRKNDNVGTARFDGWPKWPFADSTCTPAKIRKERGCSSGADRLS